MRSPGKRGREVFRCACPRRTLFAPSRSRALRKFPDGNFRRPLVGSRRALTSAEMVALRCNAAARQGLPPRRAPFGRKESPPWAGVPPDAVCPRLPGRPHRTPPPPRSAAPLSVVEPSRCVPAVEKIARLGVLVLAEAWSRALFSQQRQMGTCCARWHAGTVRCRWARLSRVDPLCDRMERGEEEATAGRRIAFQRSHFCRRKGRRLPTSDRRKFPSGNFRSARDFEGAERVNPRKAYRTPAPSGPSPFARKRGMSPFTVSGSAAGRDSSRSQVTLLSMRA